MKNSTTTLEVGGAQVTIDTRALFAAWMEKHLLGNVQAPACLAIPPLKEGERYIGAILGDDGHGHHIIRMPQQFDRKFNWSDAMNVANDHGGELPDRVEGALLFAKKQDGEYEDTWYWTREQYAGDESCVWSQSFDDGHQYGLHKDYDYRVVLVRRVAI